MQLTAKHIAGARAILGLTREELAELCDVSPMTITNIELERHSPYPGTLDKIQRALESRGIEFTNGDGIGVRLRINPTASEKSPAA